MQLGELVNPWTCPAAEEQKAQRRINKMKASRSEHKETIIHNLVCCGRGNDFSMPAE